MLDRLQSLPVPSVAIIGGACLGGGLELALACDYRVVVQGTAVRLGFANAELGLLPAWGGTQRLPRIVGLERCLPLLLGDWQMSPERAVQWKLADAVVPRNQNQPPAFLAEPCKRPVGFLPWHAWRQCIFEHTRWGRAFIFRGIHRLLKRRLADDLPAPWEIVEAVRRGLTDGIEAGLELEREAFARLSQTDAFHNLLRLQEVLVRIRGENPETKPMRHIGVNGADTLGLLLLAWITGRGCHAVLRERDETALGTALYQLMTMFLSDVKDGTLLPEEARRRLAAVKGTTSWKGFDELDLILETALPDGDAQATLFQEMDRQTRSTALLASTSVAGPLEKLRAGLEHPERLVRLHFDEPVTRGCLVEVVGPPDVDQGLAKRLSAWVEHLGGVPVMVRDRPGLLVQRIGLAAVQEAILLLREGLALPLIDEAMRRFGMLRGPLQWADLVGLDQLKKLTDVLVPLAPERFLQDGILNVMVEKGWLGRKTRLGFYSYDRSTPRPNPGLGGVLGDLGRLDHSLETIRSRRDQLVLCRQRIVARIVNESVWCLEDGIVDNAATLDLALTLAGWPAHRGGPLAYLQQHETQNKE